ncbi:protein of unknown function (plasmid) [Streptantibioticus cattleyicolor NRRL 8057 = DSM 46488]|nr:protein of unknown function [Streptantibioticus cattleyicolor NRRL 8057 = DSM 46488]
MPTPGRGEPVEPGCSAVAAGKLRCFSGLLREGAEPSAPGTAAASVPRSRGCGRRGGRGREGGGEERESFGAVGARVGVVDDEFAARRGADAQPLPVESYRTDLRVVDADRGALAGVHVVAGPQAAEQGAGEGEFADQLDEPGVVRVGADRLAEPGDHVRRGALPVGVEGPLGGVEEGVPQAVVADDETRGQRGCQGVGGEDVEVAALDEGGERQGGDELGDARRDGLLAGPAPLPPGPGGAEPQQVRRRVLVEPQDAGDGFQDLHRRVAVAALFQTQVVVGADAGEHRDLLPAQPRHPAHARDGDTGLLRGDERAAGAYVIAQLVRFVGHPPTVVSAPARLPGPLTPRIAGALAAAEPGRQRGRRDERGRAVALRTSPDTHEEHNHVDLSPGPRGLAQRTVLGPRRSVAGVRRPPGVRPVTDRTRREETPARPRGGARHPRRRRRRAHHRRRPR